jgi:hypothetical protein
MCLHSAVGDLKWSLVPFFNFLHHILMHWRKGTFQLFYAGTHQGQGCAAGLLQSVSEQNVLWKSSWVFWANERMPVVSNRVLWRVCATGHTLPSDALEFTIKLQDCATRRNSASGRCMSRPRQATSWPERVARRGPRQTSDTSQQAWHTSICWDIRVQARYMLVYAGIHYDIEYTGKS